MFSAALLAALAFQMAQNPSPMTDQTRSHGRIAQTGPVGRHAGRVVVIGRPGPLSPVILHFHGESWLAEQAVASVYPSATVVALYLGNSSDIYRDAFPSPESFQALLTEAGAGKRPVILSSFSAGYGAIRAILRHSSKRIDAVLLMDSLHAGYLGRDLDPADLDIFLAFAKDAIAGRKRLLITHSEVYPGTFASTTETVDWLIRELKLRRVAILVWGPGGMQQLSEVHRGRLTIRGFAGNSAPDHVDHLHGMATWLRVLRRL